MDNKDQWVIIDGRGQRINQQLLTEAQADTEIRTILEKHALTEGKSGAAAPTLIKRRYLAG